MIISNPWQKTGKPGGQFRCENNAPIRGWFWTSGDCCCISVPCQQVDPLTVSQSQSQWFAAGQPLPKEYRISFREPSPMPPRKMTDPPPGTLMPTRKEWEDRERGWQQKWEDREREWDQERARLLRALEQRGLPPPPRVTTTRLTGPSDPTGQPPTRVASTTSTTTFSASSSSPATATSVTAASPATATSSEKREGLLRHSFTYPGALDQHSSPSTSTSQASRRHERSNAQDLSPQGGRIMSPVLLDVFVDPRLEQRSSKGAAPPPSQPSQPHRGSVSQPSDLSGTHTPHQEVASSTPDASAPQQPPPDSAGTGDREGSSGEPKKKRGRGVFSAFKKRGERKDDRDKDKGANDKA
ncbi:uncharacterized protein BXZ73DRAFT_79470 [Epithele typhae]|uniref:uncharacterized protein n=1 Tax=Epithele typhae TaxID=378194 RepID=UPI002007D5B0|nr:uncharacterized protein BXZ73DRAFT_79470 [Epithele typhae]KAH9923399.1 hypothetical protein BXZ73DRAFT_79470 [Epithele typhae]